MEWVNRGMWRKRPSLDSGIGWQLARWQIREYGSCSGKPMARCETARTHLYPSMISTQSAGSSRTLRRRSIGFEGPGNRRERLSGTGGCIHAPEPRPPGSCPSLSRGEAAGAPLGCTGGVLGCRLQAEPNLADAFRGVDVLIHLAAGERR